MIPKIIHQIWIGTSEIPDREKKFIEKCKNLHPDWEYKFWGNEEIKQLFPKYEEIYLKLCNKTPADVADYLRLVILYEYGGIYLDCDIEMNQSLNKLDLSKNFLISISAGCFTRFQNCFLASEKNNIFLKYLLNNESHKNISMWGPAFITKKYKEFFHGDEIRDLINNDPKDFYDQVFMMGNLIKKIECKNDHDFLPISYFFKGEIGKHHFLLSHVKENKDKFKIK